MLRERSAATHPQGTRGALQFRIGASRTRASVPASRRIRARRPGTQHRIVDNEIGHLLATEKEATVLFVADSCFAGGMTRSADSRVPVGVRTPGVGLRASGNVPGGTGADDAVAEPVLSLVCSMVSTSPILTLTSRPAVRLSAASDALAPRCRAVSMASAAISRNESRSCS